MSESQSALPQGKVLVLDTNAQRAEELSNRLMAADSPLHQNTSPCRHQRPLRSPQPFLCVYPNRRTC